MTHIAKGAEDVEARSTDEVSARLRSFDLRRHRIRERTLTSGFVAACIITALVLVAALYASTHRGGTVPQPGQLDSDAELELQVAKTTPRALLQQRTYP